MTEKPMSEKELKFRISHSIQPVQEKYTALLNQKKQELIGQHQIPPDVSLEERERLYNLALKVGQYGKVDSTQMAHEWDSFDKRSPIAGSQTEKDD